MSFRTRHSKSRFAASLAAGVVGVLAALPVLAQVDLGLAPVAEGTGLATGDIRSQIAGIIRVFFGLLGIIAVGLILYAGWLWMTAQGDDSKVETAKGVLKNAVIGLIIILSAYAIATFVINAITGGSGGGIGQDGCAVGQDCGPRTYIDPISGPLRVVSILPSGAGGATGAPKNARITVTFNKSVDQSTVGGSTVRVQRCNPRVNGNDEPQPFDAGDCTEAIVGNPNVDGSKLYFRPRDNDDEPNPSYFSGDYWYFITLFNGPRPNGIFSAGGTSLACPTPGDPSLPTVPNDACTRAMAFGDFVDVERPTVRITSPSSPPKSCGVPARLPIVISAEDDYLVADVEVLLDGKIANLVDAAGAPFVSTPVSTNIDGKNPFVSSDIYIDTAALTPGSSYTISAVAYDLVPQASTSASRNFVMAPAHCCNDVQDVEEGETGIDCGPAVSGCGFCAGNSCTVDEDCNSGFCDPATKLCVERPIIQGVTPWNGGPGSFITLTGQFFGATPGNVVFLGDPADEGDNRIAQACSPQAWSPTQVVVQVPIGAADGPLRLVANDGRYDDTTADSPPGAEASFDVTDITKPGICYLDPFNGPVGRAFVAHGSGFGASIGPPLTESFGKMGTTTMGIEQWAADAVRFLVPSVRNGEYPVRLWIGGASGEQTNEVTFAVQPTAEDADPVITGVTPTNGPAGQYITLTGSGFGNRKGVVKFFDGPIAGSPEIAVADEPLCDDSWHDNYVVVKVPKEYQAGLASGVVNPVALKTHLVRIETAAPSKISNTVDFVVDTSPLTPGLCSMSPLAGPPSTLVTIEGEGFGKEGPNTDTGSPQYTVDFYNGSDATAPGSILRMIAENYSGWSSTEVTARVPGDPSDQASWPKTGPVTVTAKNVRSANAIPFQVVNCNDAPSACGAGTQCCSDGACRGEPNWCGPVSLESAYGFVFSTETLPALPQVVERSLCTDTLVQSPSPAKGSTDACRNADLDIEISREIDASTVDASTFVIIACGTGAAADCSAGTVLSGVAYAVVSNGNGGSVLYASPPDGLARNTWYRVTLVSDPDAVAPNPKGLRDAVNGHYLDGDYDRVQGGNYTYLFRTRDSDDACELSRVTVTPSKYLIDHQGFPASPTRSSPTGFRANMLAANCNPLSCEIDDVPQYDMDWFTEDPDTLLLPDLSSGSCAAVQPLPITADRETVAGDTVALSVAVRAIGETASLEGSSAVTVAFTDPVVTDKFPDCDEACVDAQVGADFNVPMDAGTLTATNIKIFRCRNASCNAPYADTDTPSIGTIRYATEGSSTMGFRFGVLDGMEPGAFYKVILQGGSSGIESASGVPLTGLNEADSYAWTFHTKADGTPCLPHRSIIEPSVVRMTYIGQRQDFLATPIGAPDSCEPSGQRLNPDAYNWEWDRSLPPGAVPGSPFEVYEQMFNGFLTTDVSFDEYLGIAVSPATLDTLPYRPAGCSSDCRLIGSQIANPQCGNGRVERGEACDREVDPNTGDMVFPFGCSPSTCLWMGTLGVADGGSCGDGIIDDGEECDMVDDPTTGGKVFPPGCLVPEPDKGGCLLQGSSSAANSRCGDALVGDGEACDDGNSRNGDGCSRECLLEGSLPSCAEVDDGVPCVSYCGNGIVEPGEERVCEETAGGPSAAGCDTARCILLGTPPCAAQDGVSCCGNFVVDPGEEAICESSQFPHPVPGCSDRCVLKGSSYTYDYPSFCGDGRVGFGEAPACEEGGGTDEKIDAYQGYQAVILSATDAGGSVTTITADLDSINEERAGTADVSISCTCSGVSAFCGGLSAIPLSCNANGCCAPAPQVVQPTYPANSFNDVCRNTQIRITFDQAMHKTSVEQNMFVGVHSPTQECPTGTEMPDLWHAGDQFAYETGKQPVWKRAWNTVAGFFRSLFSRDAKAAAAGSYPGNDARYCLVQGSVAVAGRVVTWSPAVSLPADTWVRVAIVGGDTGAKSASTAPMLDTFEMYFGTGTEICKIDRVSIEPSVHLFTIAEDLGPVGTPADEIDGDRVFTARAHPRGQPSGASIASTPEYAFKWNWDDQLDTSVIDLTASTLDDRALNGYCEDGESLTSEDCRIRLDLIPAPKPAPGVGNGVCEEGENATIEAACKEKPGQAQSADVIVRRDGTGFPHDGKAVVRVTADIAENRVNKTGIGGTSDVTVLLCRNPWPARRICTSDGSVLRPTVPGSGVFGLPWDDDATCDVAGPYWSPFYDPATNISFYYCRDGGAGDEGDLLPALDEDMIFVEPGGNVLREYLFPSSNGDAIGLRIAKNPQHRSTLDWYRLQGFLGNPGATTVGGYPAIQEGRTTYVGSAAVTIPGGIFTNVNVLSYSNGAKPETVAVYNQLLKNFDLNTNVTDLGYCTWGSQQALFDPDHLSDGAPFRYGYTTVQETETVDAVTGRVVDAENPSTSGETVTRIKGVPAAPVACSSDRDCWVNPGSGAMLPDGFYTAQPDYRSIIRCATPKSKLVRDVGRWGDLHAIRDGFLVAGVYPTLEAGTFLRARTNSAWESWTAALGATVGFTPPSDPLNTHSYCGPSGAFDPDSCWNATDKVYRCSAGSHVYTYRSIGGSAFSVAMDLESNCSAYTTEALCGTSSPVCTWSAGACVSAAAWGGDVPGTCLEYGNPGSCETALGGVCSNDPTRSCVVANGAAGCGGAPCVSTCTWDTDGFCSYRYGQARMGGLASGMSQCQDITEGIGGICGDGILNDVDEECEPNVPIPLEPCTAGTSPVRSGTRQDSCTTSCKKVVGVCQVGVCGDGVVQSPERCDDGSLNGEYGKCKTDCGLSRACQTDPTCTGIGMSCGDGLTQPGEACDCGPYNGAYIRNASLQTPGFTCTVPSSSSSPGWGCAWDCRGAGPRCGDGIVNGSEECDTETQTSRGYCSDDAESPCTTSEDCPMDGAVHFICGNIPAEPERSNIRTCNTQTAGAQSCTWGSWRLTEPGKCGNGIKETGEECDDGMQDTRSGDAGACVIDIGRRECKTNVCGDGYLNKAGGEECDSGSANGDPCIPEYGIDCNYCSGSCKIVTISGGYCGDGIIQGAGTNPPGPEQCEPTLAVPSTMICRSTDRYFRSWGLNIGTASCDIRTCRFVCPYDNANLCENTGSSNKDKKDSNADKTTNFQESFYAGIKTPTGEVVTESRISNMLVDRCDYDKDGDGVPDEFDCAMHDGTTHGAYTYGNINIPKAVELCDGIDNDCDGHVDNSPPVDMLFLLDGSGTMEKRIAEMADAIRQFVGTFRGGGHAFAIGRIDQKTISNSVAYNPSYSRVQNFTTNIDTFLTAVDGVVADSGGGYERALDLLHDVFTGNRAGFNWRSHVKRRIVVVVTDAAGMADVCRLRVENGKCGTVGADTIGCESTWCNLNMCFSAWAPTVGDGAMAMCDYAVCTAESPDGFGYSRADCDPYLLAVPTQANTRTVIDISKFFAAVVGGSVETWTFTTSSKDGGWEVVTGEGSTFRFQSIPSDDNATKRQARVDAYEAQLRAGPFLGVCAPPPETVYDICTPNPCSIGVCIEQSGGYTCVH